MLKDNRDKLTDIKLQSRKVKLWTFLLALCGIYAIIVTVVLFSEQVSLEAKAIVIFSYMIIAPITYYALWIKLYFWKREKMPLNKEIYGSKLNFFIFFVLIGICVVTWAAYWNTGIGTFWYALAVVVLMITKDELLASVIYTVGSIAVTPALVEEFLKSFPSILAFFVVLQRKKNPERKRKGILGNELNGFFVGLIVGLVFEIIELIYYLVLTFLSGGGLFYYYVQVTVRNWAPIHILGGAMGGYAAGRAERLRFERGEEDAPFNLQLKNFLKRFLPFWLIPVSIHFLWNSSSVWIILYVYATNNQATGLADILEIIVIVSLSSLCFILLLLFLRKANRAAINTHQCELTGLYILEENITCEPISDDSKPVSSQYLPKEANLSSEELDFFCLNCGVPVKKTYRFCINCGMNFDNYRYYFESPKLYNKSTRNLLIVAIIFGCLFLFFSLLTFLIIFLLLGAISLLLLFTQTTFEIIAGILILYSAINLLKLRKNYNGRRSIRGWHILLFNIIGMLGMLLFMGLAFLIGAVLAYLSNDDILYFVQLIIGGLFLIGALIIFIFLLFALKNGEQILQYQR